MIADKREIEPCPETPEPFVTLVEDGFGIITEEGGTKEIVRRYTFTNQNYLIIQVISYGASIVSIKYPDKNGVSEDVVLGFDDLIGYMESEGCFSYFGATIGRYANRIAKGHFKIGHEDYQLTKNHGEHHFHGGFKGFDKVNWKSEIQNKKVVMTYLSRDGDEGYPGELLTSVTFEMTSDNDFITEIKATTSKATPVNVSNNTYFNLGGHSKGAESLYEHEVTINADKFCHTDENLIPTGLLKNVVNTWWDLRIPRKLGSIIMSVPYGGYDQNLCIHKTDNECLTFNARVVHPLTGRVLEIYSNQPAIHFYTCNYFPKKQMIPASRTSEVNVSMDGCQVRRCPLCGQLTRDPDFESEEASVETALVSQVFATKTYMIIGKEDAEYYKHAGFCLMTQNYPDAVHRKNFPNSILKPGDTYYHLFKYKFLLTEEIDIFKEYEENADDLESVSYEGEHEGEEGDDKEKDDLLDPKMEENGR